ncbi:MAG: hypothetical protein ACK551_02900 [Vampirovibrionales bacterium]
MQELLRTRSIHSFLQYCFGLPSWVHGILMCVALSVYSMLSPLWGLIKTAFAPYIDLNVFTQSPEQTLSALTQFANFIELNPNTMQDLQLTLLTYLIFHLIYMMFMWKFTLWTVEVLKERVHSD